MKDVRNFIGIPFKVHGRDFNGIDCWGLDILYFKHFFNINLPDYNYESLDEREFIKTQILKEKMLEKIDKPQENCIIEITKNRYAIHTGVYLGEGQFIHATEDFGVIIEPLSRYKTRIRGFYKVKDCIV